MTDKLGKAAKVRMALLRCWKMDVGGNCNANSGSRVRSIVHRDLLAEPWGTKQKEGT